SVSRQVFRASTTRTKPAVNTIRAISGGDSRSAMPSPSAAHAATRWILKLGCVRTRVARPSKAKPNERTIRAAVLADEAKRPQGLLLASAHACAIGVGLVVVAEHMQDPVGDQVADLAIR